MIDIHDPDFIIDCSTIDTSAGIYKVIRDYGDPKIYCYAFCYRIGLKIEFIKFGESAPLPGTNTAEAIGERIKRQLEHVPGWNDPPYYSSHGDDFWSNLNREIQLGNIKHLNKNDLIVGVWNLENRLHKIDFLYDRNKDISLHFEGLLCKQYKERNDGRLPILNIKDPTRNKAFRGPKLNKNLFEFA